MKTMHTVSEYTPEGTAGHPTGHLSFSSHDSRLRSVVRKSHDLHVTTPPHFLSNNTDTVEEVESIQSEAKGDGVLVIKAVSGRRRQPGCTSRVRG